jgi:hypothetical protein
MSTPFEAINDFDTKLPAQSTRWCNGPAPQVHAYEYPQNGAVEVNEGFLTEEEDCYNQSCLEEDRRGARERERESQRDQAGLEWLLEEERREKIESQRDQAGLDRSSFSDSADARSTPPAFNNPFSRVGPMGMEQSFNNADNADNADEGDTPFPLDCLPPVLREIIREVGRSLLVPDELTAVCALGTVSAALGAGLEIFTGPGRTLRGNLFLLGVADSGNGKGQAFETITSPWFEFDRELARKWCSNEKPRIEAEILSLEMRLKAKAKSIKGKGGETGSPQVLDDLAVLKRELHEAQGKKSEPQLIVGDITSEALAVAMAKGHLESLSSMSSEARGCVDVLAGRYNKKSDEAIYLSGFSGDPYRVDRISNRTVRLNRPCLSVLWLMQPDKLHEILANKALTESGLLPRFLLCCTKAEPQFISETALPIDPSVLSAWAALVGEIASNFHQAASARHITASCEAQRAMNQFYNVLVSRRKSGGDLQDINIYVARWVEQSWRLALVLHAALHKKDAAVHHLDGTTASNAIQIVEWFAQHQMAVLAAGREERRTEKLFRLIDVLQTKPSRSCTLRDLKRRHNIDESTVRAIALEHADKLIVEKQTHAGRGRPTEIVRLV